MRRLAPAINAAPPATTLTATGAFEKVIVIFLVRFSLVEHFYSTATATKKEVVWVAWDLLACGRDEEGGQNDNFLDHHDEMKWGPKSKNKSSRRKQEKI